MNTNAANSRNDGARYARPTASERPSRAVQRITSRHRTGASARDTRSGGVPRSRGAHRVRMRRVAIVMLAVAVGLGIAMAGVLLGPRLDPRWRSVTTRDASIAQRLTRDARAPLLFVPGSVTRDPAPAVTLVVVLPGLGGAGRDLAEQFVGVAEDERWLLLAPSPNYDPFDANESLLAADLRVDNELVMLVGEVMAGSSLHVAPLIDLVGFSRGAQSAHRFALRHP